MKRIRPARLLAAVVVLMAMAAPALAHVSVNPSSAAKGSFAKLTFRVPNERDDASTAKVEVFLPTDQPIVNVSVKPTPGWTVAVEKSKLPTPLKTDDGDTVTEAVSHITWSGGTIKPGEFQEFDVSVGPLPDKADNLVFKAIQTYSSGEVVRWIEEAAAGASEPEHPAPVLTLTAATGDHHDAGSESASEGASGGGSSSSDGTARALGGAGLVLGLVGALAAVAALTRGRN
jgi:uncharacterized protein YcnI